MSISSPILTYGPAGLLALMLHSAVLWLLMTNWSEGTDLIVDLQPYYIEATVVTENPFRSRAERERQRQQAAREKRLQQRREAEASLREEQAAWEREKQRLEEQHRQKAEQIDKAPETLLDERKARGDEQAVSQEQARRAMEESLARALAAEQAYRKAVTNDEKTLAYMHQIGRVITANWSRPPSARNGMVAELRVWLIPTGEVIDVNLEKSSGDDAFDRSAMQAVKKSRTLPVPEDITHFERDFRRFTLVFRPEDLRL